LSARRRTACWISGLLAAVLSVAARAAVTCTVSATGPAFGLYNPLTTTPTLANGQVSASCTLTGTTTTTVALVSSYSTGSSGSYAARTMLSGANALSYNLYYDAAFSQVRGDGTGGSQTGGASFTLTRTAPTQSVTSVIYGRIPALQDVAAGSYLDTIVFTVTY
jgi:spore coat protein U-like protein